MVAINPPGFLQNAGATHTAEQFRNWIGARNAGFVAATPLIPRGGVNVNLGNALQVTQQGSPNMSVIVRSGLAEISGTEGARQGIYSVLNDADFTVAITTAHATLGRIDSIVFKVEDQQYSGVNNTSSIVAVAGTPSGSPAPPTLPFNCIELARVTVGANVTTIVTANIADMRIYLAAVGGIITCLSTTRPATTTIKAGQAIYETDTKKMWVYDGAAFRLVLSDLGSAIYTPIKVQNTNAQTGITGTTFSPGSPVVSTTFVAPPSGIAYFNVSGWLQNTVAGFYTVLDYELRTGGVVGSGTIVHQGDGTTGLLTGQSITNLNATRRTCITGLTVGSTYNVQLMHAVNAGGNGTILHRELLIEPGLLG